MVTFLASPWTSGNAVCGSKSGSYRRRAQHPKTNTRDRRQFYSAMLPIAARVIRAIIRDCADAGIPLYRVVVDEQLFAWLTLPGAEPTGPRLGK